MSSNDLCEELLVEIFSRLPPKSLLRLRSLSKWSYACIGSPDFIRLHARRSKDKVMVNKVMVVHDTSNITRCLYYERPYAYTLHSEDQLPFTRNIYKTEVDYPFKGCKIIGSCNGILCVYECRKGNISLWNPSIRRKLAIPGPPHECYQLSMVYDPRSEYDDVYDPQSIGFGYDPIIDDYKILIITKPSSFVYSMKTRTWDEIASPPGIHVDSCQCLFNGALYCAITTSDLNRCFIMRFDLRSEVFTMIDSPQPDASGQTRVVTTINGHLALMSGKDDVCWIWVRVEEKERNNSTASAAASWHVAFTLKLDARDFHWTCRIFQLTAINALLLANDHVLYNNIVIDLETHEKSRLAELSYFSIIDGVSMFTETLELLGMGTYAC